MTMGLRGIAGRIASSPCRPALFLGCLSFLFISTGCVRVIHYPASVPASVSAAGDLPAAAEPISPSNAPTRVWPRAEGSSRDEAAASEVARAASQWVGVTQWAQRGFRSDCSGFVGAVYDAAGQDLREVLPAASSGTEALYRLAQSEGGIFQVGLPRPGDLVFFHDTYDRDGDGRLNDAFTHVAVVETVETGGTVVMIHLLEAGVTRSRMTLSQPAHGRGADGRVLNDTLRRASGRTPAALTSTLFHAFGRL